MYLVLDAVETRVLAALVEKEITTPEYYPLSLNALVNACNQKSNRDPAMELDEAAVRSALRALDDKALARSAVAIDSRVAKYEHQLQEAFNFTRPETAILCELMLRGPQTPGELRGRASRLHPFEDLAVVHSALERLMHRQPPLVRILERQPGTKEARYAQLLSGEPEPLPVGPVAELPQIVKPSPEARIAALEDQVTALKSEIESMKRDLARFGKPLG
jgi:uncharacterized protein YceH (UPF0502 family)